MRCGLKHVGHGQGCHTRMADTLRARGDAAKAWVTRAEERLAQSIIKTAEGQMEKLPEDARAQLSRKRFKYTAPQYQGKSGGGPLGGLGGLLGGGK